MQFLRTNAPYITLPVAAIVGVIGYNLESLLSDRYTPYNSKSYIEISCLIQRMVTIFHLFVKINRWLTLMYISDSTVALPAQPQYCFTFVSYWRILLINKAVL